MNSDVTLAFAFRADMSAMDLLIVAEVEKNNFFSKHSFIHLLSQKAKMKKIVQQIVRRAHPMNSDVEAMETACQWKSIAMESSTALTGATKTCADLKQTRVQFRTMIVKISLDYSRVMILASHS
jgi:hypothetical protein